MKQENTTIEWKTEKKMSFVFFNFLKIIVLLFLHRMIERVHLIFFHRKVIFGANTCPYYTKFTLNMHAWMVKLKQRAFELLDMGLSETK